MVRVARRCGGVRGWMGPIENAWLAPPHPHLSDDHIDLRVGQHAACMLREGWHRGSANAVGNHAADTGVVGNPEIDGVRERNRGSSFSIGTMASGAVVRVQGVEVRD